MNSSLTPSKALIEHALSLIAAAEIEGPAQAPRLREELAKWCAASVAHASAYEHALRQWQMLSDVAPVLRTRFTEPAPLPVRKRRKSRTHSTLAVVACVLCFTGLLGWYIKQPVLDQAVQTGVAQLVKVALPDGSSIDVNAKSTLRITFYRGQRVVELISGEARFDVASDAARPFRVKTRVGMVEVIGTAFVIADRGEPVTVDVERGRVRFTSATDLSVQLAGGEHIVVRNGISGPVENTGAREIAPWRDGWLAFDNERLADALLAINAFRAMPIVLADARAGQLRLTGRFRANDTRTLLAALPKILPVDIVDHADGTIAIRSRY